MSINMKIRASKTELLAALRTNREEHQDIVKEAREGYVAKARVALASRLDELECGKIVSLTFSLHPPLDCTKEYDAAIRMLELHQDESVDLDETLVRCFVLNEWGWMQSFLTQSSQYSSKAAGKLG